MNGSLSGERVERVLDRLGFASKPDTSLEGLTQLYGSWCRRVPFDNIRKLIHVRAGKTATLPGDTPNEFFEAWLAHGTGATCWAANGALCDLLVSIGFDARGDVTRTALTDVERKAFLIDEVGVSEEVVDLLPGDVEAPPPPGSRTAARAR